MQSATVGSAFRRDAEDQPRFVPSGFNSGTSDVRGELKLVLDSRRYIDRTGLYAIRYGGGNDALVGVSRPNREDLQIGKPITIVMHPACRVRLRVDCPGLPRGRAGVSRGAQGRPMAAIGLGRAGGKRPGTAQC